MGKAGKQRDSRNPQNAVRLNDLPIEVDERLWRWGNFFRDRQRKMHCGSAEGNYKPHSDDYAAEGWGEAPPPPKTPIERPRAVLEAIETNDAVMQLSKIQKWSLTYFYCYPGLPRFVVLKCLRKYSGRRLSWKEYLDQVDIGRMHVIAIVDTRN